MNVSIISDTPIHPVNSTIETACTGCLYPSRIFLPPKTSIMKLRLFILLFIALPVLSQAQLGSKLFNKVKNKVKNILKLIFSFIIIIDKYSIYRIISLNESKLGIVRAKKIYFKARAPFLFLTKKVERRGRGDIE